MTLLFLGLCLVFGFFAFRHFRNGRMVWGTFAGIGSSLMAGAVWVDFQRASDEVDKLAPVAKGSGPASPPVIGDYKPPASDSDVSKDSETNSAR